MEEIEGMADGSGIPSYLIKMFTLVEEFSYVMPQHLAYSYRDHCSDQIVKEDNFSTPLLPLSHPHSDYWTQ